MTTRRIALVPAAALVLALAGCGGSGGTHETHASTSAARPSSASAAEAIDPKHSDADVEFASMMIPHHEQAVDMAGMVEDGEAGQEVRGLAGRIEKAQAPEIERMSAMLSAWGEPVPTGDAHDMHGGHGGHGTDDPMPGMMSEAEMARLGTLRGEKFDRAWLTMMIEHHEGAVTMARAELKDGENPQARELAQQILDAQEQEIDEMRGLLKR